MNFNYLLPLIILFCINILIIVKRVGNVEIKVWMAFSIGAIILMLRGKLYQQKAIDAITRETDLFLFLFGMFILVTSLEISGLLDKFSSYLIRLASNDRSMITVLVIGFGTLSSILLNDTIAFLAPMIIISFGRRNNRDIRPFIIMIAISISIGSALFPTGNPQNFLLSIRGSVEFLQFSVITLIPVLISLFTLIIYFNRVFHSQMNNKSYSDYQIINNTNSDYQTLGMRTSIIMTITIPIMILAPYLGISMATPILFGGLLIIIISKERKMIVKQCDWSIIILFAGMFVVIDAISEIDFVKNFLLSLVNKPLEFSNLALFLVVIFALSQIISNVPVAILISNIMVGTPFDQPFVWVMVAIVSTYSGATSVMGAASNFIVLETSRKREIEITWLEFTKIGLPISLICLSEVLLYLYVYMIFI